MRENLSSHSQAKSVHGYQRTIEIPFVLLIQYFYSLTTTSNEVRTKRIEPMDKKMPATKDDDERLVGEDGEESTSKPEDDKKPPTSSRKKRAEREEEDVLEQYREHYRAAAEEEGTLDDKIRNILYPETETEAEREASIDLCARQCQKMDEIRRAGRVTPLKLKKRKLASNSTINPPPTAASRMGDLTQNIERFNREKAELEDPTIPPHNFKVGDAVKMKFANHDTLKISERAGMITEINDDGTVNIARYEKSFGAEHPSRHNVEKKVNPRNVRTFKRRKSKTTVRVNVRF